MNKLPTNTYLTKALLTLGLTFGGLAAAQTPLAFRSVAHVTSDLSTALDDTWTTLSERGYSGVVTAMTNVSVTYVFTQGTQELEVTLHQTTGGVTIMTRDPDAALLASY